MNSAETTLVLQPLSFNILTFCEHSVSSNSISRSVGFHSLLPRLWDSERTTAASCTPQRKGPSRMLCCNLKDPLFSEFLACSSILFMSYSEKDAWRLLNSSWSCSIFVLVLCIHGRHPSLWQVKHAKRAESAARWDLPAESTDCKFPVSIRTRGSEALDPVEPLKVLQARYNALPFRDAVSAASSKVKASGFRISIQILYFNAVMKRSNFSAFVMCGFFELIFPKSAPNLVAKVTCLGLRSLSGPDVHDSKENFCDD